MRYNVERVKFVNLNTVEVGGVRYKVVNADEQRWEREFNPTTGMRPGDLVRWDGVVRRYGHTYALRLGFADVAWGGGPYWELSGDEVRKFRGRWVGCNAIADTLMAELGEDEASIQARRLSSPKPHAGGLRGRERGRLARAEEVER